MHFVGTIGQRKQRTEAKDMHFVEAKDMHFVEAKDMHFVGTIGQKGTR